METYITMLRGINVSGQKKIAMAGLKSLFETLDFSGVRTYIQSGNIVFRSRKTAEQKLTEKIEAALLEAYGFEVKTFVRTVDEWQRTIDNNPFMDEKGIDEGRLYVSFLHAAPSAQSQEHLGQPSPGNDRFLILGRDIYLYCPGGYGETKLSNTFFEKKLKCAATTRNWKTVNELLRIARS